MYKDEYKWYFPICLSFLVTLDRRLEVVELYPQFKKDLSSRWIVTSLKLRQRDTLTIKKKKKYKGSVPQQGGATWASPALFTVSRRWPERGQF